VNGRLSSLAAIENEVWHELGQAVADKQHEWRTPVLATVHGETADARTVVLRELDARQKQLLIYTDERAGKVVQMLRQPHGTLVMWSPRLSWQLRCRVMLSLEMSGLAASSRWAQIRLSPAAQDYLSPLPPGAELDAPAPGTHEPVQRDYFAIICAQVLSIDWLELHEQGHRRAAFDERGSRWLQP
jgi:hypothetical protein